MVSDSKTIGKKCLFGTFAAELLDLTGDGVLEIAHDLVTGVFGSRFIEFEEVELFLIEVAAVLAEDEEVDGGVEVVGDGGENVTFGELTFFPVASSACTEPQFFQHCGNCCTTFFTDRL